MRARKPVQTTMEKPVPVRLTDPEMADRAQEIAAKILHVKVLRKKKRDDARNTQVLIDSELDQVELLADTITDARELRKQGELFADQETAVRTLAEVGKTACLCPPEAMAVGSVLVDCPVHGDDAPVPWVVNVGVSDAGAAVADDEEEHDGAEEDEDDDEQDDEDDEAAERIAEAAGIAAGAIASVTAGGASSAAPTRTRTGRGPLARASGRRAPAPRAHAKARR
jgi:hypothetical protein